MPHLRGDNIIRLHDGIGRRYPLNRGRPCLLVLQKSVVVYRRIQSLRFRRSCLQDGDGCWWKVCGIFQITRQFPDLQITQGCAASRHTRQADPILNFPINFAGGIVDLLRVWLKELRWSRDIPLAVPVGAWSGNPWQKAQFSR